MVTKMINKKFLKARKKLEDFRTRNGIKEQVSHQFFNAYWYQRLHPMASTANKAFSQLGSPCTIQHIINLLKKDSNLAEIDRDFKEEKREISLISSFFLVCIPNFLCNVMIFFIVSILYTLLRYGEIDCIAVLILIMLSLLWVSSNSIFACVEKSDLFINVDFPKESETTHKDFLLSRKKLEDFINDSAGLHVAVVLGGIPKTNDAVETHPGGEFFEIDKLIVKKLTSYFVKVFSSFSLQCLIEQIRKILKFLLELSAKLSINSVQVLYERGVGCTSVGGIAASSVQHALSLLSVYLGIARDAAVSQSFSYPLTA
jgi:hypothetical protein